MTIRELIKRERNNSLGLTLNDRLEEMKECKDINRMEEYKAEKHMLLGMIQTLFCVHAITDTEFLEIMEDIRKNY